MDTYFRPKISWVNELAYGIKQAIQSDLPCRVAVHSQAQMELGQRAVERMDGNPDVTFELIPEAERHNHLIGDLLL